MPIGGPNLFGLHQYDYKKEFFATPPLSIQEGYGFVIGVSAFFVVLIISFVLIDKKWGLTKYNSEHFQTAGRTVKTGLISVDIQSHWTWSSTLLQSANQVYQYGVSGAYWYAGAAVVQVLCFGILAVYVKKRAPTAHTVLEIVHARWGSFPRFVFLYFLIVTAIVVSGQLILGGSAVITALTGANVYALIFIIPAFVAVYTATFTSSYIHTALIFIVLLIMMFTVFTHSPKGLLGSPSQVYDNLQVVSRLAPVSGNRGGSYLTFWSIDGLKFGILQAVSCWGITVVDQAYWQSAIAARPSAAYKGYILGALLWFAIPMGLATSLGLAVIALDLPLTPTEAGDGLVPPAAAVALLGRFGGTCIVLIVLMAITSSGSAEMISISSLLTFDVYKAYIHKSATGKQLLWVSRICVIFFATVMACVSVIFYKANINLNFLYFLMATATCGAVPPLAASILWARCSAIAAVTAALVGQALGVAAWLVEAHIQYSELSTTTLQQINPALTGGCFSLGVSTILTVVLSLIFPQHYDWVGTRTLSVFNDTSKDKAEIAGEESHTALVKAEKIIWTWSAILTFIFLFGWPLLVLPAGVFSKGYFYWWVILTFVWALVATCTAISLPIIESRAIILDFLSFAPGLKRFRRNRVASGPSTKHLVDLDDRSSSGEGTEQDSKLAAQQQVADLKVADT